MCDRAHSAAGTRIVGGGADGTDHNARPNCILQPTLLRGTTDQTVLRPRGACAEMAPTTPAVRACGKTGHTGPRASGPQRQAPISSTIIKNRLHPGMILLPSFATRLHRLSCSSRLQRPKFLFEKSWHLASTWQRVSSQVGAMSVQAMATRDTSDAPHCDGL